MELTGRLDPLRRAQHTGAFWSSPALLAVASSVAIVVIGALVAVQPVIALALVGLAVFAGVLTGVAQVPFGALLIITTLIVVGVVDLPRQIAVGPVSGYALITIALSLLLALVSVSRYVLSALRGTGLLFVPLYAYAIWALLSMVWFRPSFVGAQNILVYAAFTAVVPVTAAAVVRSDLRIETVHRAITYSILIASGLYACSLALGGLGGKDVVGARSYALLAVIGVAWGVAHVRFGNRRLGVLLAALCTLFILLSLSRLAFGAAILLLVVAALDVRTPKAFMKSLLAVGTVALIAYFSVTSFGPMADRFAQGDVQTVGGGVSINVMGRTELWDATWESYLDSPLIGQGAGSAEGAIESSLGTGDHPHNDYLRVLHDLGVIGLMLLAASLGGLVLHSIRALRAAPKPGVVATTHFAAALALLGFLVTMSTDNAVVYLYVVAPVGVIVGLSIGAQMRRSGPTPALGGD